MLENKEPNIYPYPQIFILSATPQRCPDSFLSTHKETEAKEVELNYSSQLP
jgi:hypothetical protein